MAAIKRAVNLGQNSELSRLMKVRFLVIAGLVALANTLFSQSADYYVMQGRGFLAQRDLTNATAQFARAVALAPNHKTANALYGIARLFNLAHHPAIQEMLDRLQVDPKG